LRGMLNRSRVPLPDGRGSVTHCENAAPKQSRDREGAVCGPQPLKSVEPLSIRLREICAIVLINVIVGAACALAQSSEGRKKKNEDKEPVTQTLPLLKDPPAAVAAESGKLVFHDSPLSNKGLLSPQTREALSALVKLNHGAQIVKLRAFVAGTGDMRRVQAIVSEFFTEKKQPLPALTTVQVGALPMEGAQTVIESVSVSIGKDKKDKDKKISHPHGLAFYSVQPGDSAPEAIARLAKAASGSMLRVTCFLDSLDRIQEARDAAARAFPSAAVNFVQPLRAGSNPAAMCEGVGESAIAGAPVKLVFTGAQMAFRDQDADLRLAFQRLEKALEPFGVSLQDTVSSTLYGLSAEIAERTRSIATGFLPAPPGVTLIVEGLPSLDASVAIEVVAASRN
jgi:enamine deaminase RidA (YjgF/YER057c/UK114 family)